jgi:hypothetical protein
LFEVPTAYGVELKFVPTPIHVVSFGQAMEPSCKPEGIDVVVAQLEKLVVASEVAPPPEATPTATHVVDVEQDKELRISTVGWSRVVHVVPSTVPTIAGRPLTTPIAAQVIAFEQDTEVRESVPDGGVCALQMEPLVVSTISIPSTAVHSSMVKQEIDSAGKDESSTLQVVPPSVDFKIPDPPPA